MRPHVLLVIGGDRPRPEAIPHEDFDHVVCADSGLDHALAVGLTPQVVIGDMDSVSVAALAEARRRAVDVLTASADKDLTDTELGIAHALELGARSLTVLAGGGDRLDHILGTLAALAHPRLASLDHVAVHLGADRIVVVHGGRSVSLELPAATTVSLVPLAGPAHGVKTTGLRWPLNGDVLHGSAARGVSNETTDREISVSVDQGVLAVVIPGHFSSGGNP